MITEKDLQFDADEYGNMLGDDGTIVYCDSRACKAPARYRVVVSVNESHDDTRDFCSACHEVYLFGVKYGRYYEATHYDEKLGRDSSQYPPEAVGKCKFTVIGIYMDNMQPFTEHAVGESATEAAKAAVRHLCEQNGAEPVECDIEIVDVLPGHHFSALDAAVYDPQALFDAPALFKQAE